MLASRLFSRTPRLARPNALPSFQPALQPLEDRVVPSNLVWVNRGQASDRFGEIFGARAEAARAVVDAVLLSWSKVLVNLNQPAIDAAPDRNTINFTIGMSGDSKDVDFGGAAAPTAFAFPTQADKDANRNGTPTAGNFTLNRGTAGQPDNGWWIDPTPTLNEEFTNVQTPFAAARPPGSPGVDLYSTINAEIVHILGQVDTAPSRFTTPISGTMTKTTLPDVAHGGGKGFYYVFDGPSGTQLLTSYDSGNNGQDVGNPTHTAGPTATNYPVPFTSQYRGALQLRGGIDPGNAAVDAETRVLAADNVANMLKDVYGYTVKLPSTIPGYTYAVAVQNGQLTIRGGPDGDGPRPAAPPATGRNVTTAPGTSAVDIQQSVYWDSGTATSSDRITLRRDGNDLVVTVDYGRDGPVGSGLDPDGDGDAPALVTRVPLGSFTSLRVATDGGDDRVVFDFSGGDFLPAGGEAFDGGAGADELTVIGGGTFDLRGTFLAVNGRRIDLTSVANVNLVGGNAGDIFTVRDWTGGLTVNGSGGNDVINLAGVPAGAKPTISGGAGNDTIFGSPGADFIDGGDGDDTISGGGGNDLILGGAGNDVLTGGGVLVGGTGRDTLIGLGNNILIGGTTAYDSDPAKLVAIQTLWGRTDLTYTQRVNQLRQGPTALTPFTVRDDGAADLLIGTFLTQNWFFVAPLDSPFGRKANDLLN